MRIESVPGGSMPTVQPKTTGGDNQVRQDVRTDVKADVREDVQPVSGIKDFSSAQTEDKNNPQYDEELMKKSVEQANKSLEIYNRVIERKVHEKTHAIMYTLRDTKTNEVIAEFPPKKIEDMIAKMWELAGLFVDKKA